MPHRKLLLTVALLATIPVLSSPAEAQFPRRMLGPLASPFGMIFRALPHRHYGHRHHRRPRAAHGRSQPSDSRAAERTGAGSRRPLAKGALPFWPVAAPDAFEDMIGYALWPREYGRQFWSHGPGDIVQAMTAPTAAYASADGTAGPRLPRLVDSANASADERAICIARVNESVARPLDRLADAITLNDKQRQKLDDLRKTIRNAIDAEAAACRGDIPATQPQRLRAMIDGLWAMRYAEFRIRPALATFYDSLDDAQKAQLENEPQTVGSNAEAGDSTPAAICSEPVTANANPFAPVARALRPTDEQQKTLQMLYGASMDMSKFLASTCPAEVPTTPAARLDAASDRILNLLHAAMNIEPMLGAFYAGLTDQQRERFNTVVR